MKHANKTVWEEQTQQGNDMQWRKKVMEVKGVLFITKGISNDMDQKDADRLPWYMFFFGPVQMFEYYKERTPGSEIEEKSIPIVWVSIRVCKSYRNTRSALDGAEE